MAGGQTSGQVGATVPPPMSGGTGPLGTQSQRDPAREAAVARSMPGAGGDFSGYQRDSYGNLMSPWGQTMRAHDTRNASNIYGTDDQEVVGALEGNQATNRAQRQQWFDDYQADKTQRAVYGREQASAAAGGESALAAQEAAARTAATQKAQADLAARKAARAASGYVAPTAEGQAAARQAAMSSAYAAAPAKAEESRRLAEVMKQRKF